jgi:hypothetical protein
LFQLVVITLFYCGLFAGGPLSPMTDLHQRVSDLLNFIEKVIRIAEKHYKGLMAAFGQTRDFELDSR